MPSENGWLLDLYEDNDDGVRLWFIMESGERLGLRQSFPTDFYAYGKPERLHQCCLFLRRRSGVLSLSKETKTDVFKPEPLCVLRVGMNGPKSLTECFRAAANEFPDLTWYNADLSVQVRHAAMYETFPMAYCAVEHEDGELTGLKVLNSRWDISVRSPCCGRWRSRRTPTPRSRNRRLSTCIGWGRSAASR